MRFLPEEEQRRLIAACFARSDLTLEQLWMRYFALGGSLSLLELDAYLNALVTLPRVDRDMVAHAVNERLDEVTGPARAPYSHSTQDAKPLHGPLKALVDLLEGAHRAPPERLPAAVAEAGRALDLKIGVYLADYDQRTLVPLRPGDAELDIDTTVGGDVYRRAGTLTRDGTLWTVLLDGVERLGVLEIVPTGDADPDDPALREQCRWLAALLGHLVTITTQYGDGLDRRRRHRRRGSPAELLWQSLPPLTGATDSIVVGVSVQPVYDLCGTVFDYALSEERAQLAMFDAGARTGSANTAVVSALAAHRAARHGGASLGEQFTAVAAELESHEHAPAVNGVLAELDLVTGVLRLLGAGHPVPLVVRRGEALPLTGPAVPRFSSAGGPPPVTELRLEPGDLLALCSRGVAETTDGAGQPFGLARITGHLGRDAGELPPEIARRLTRAVFTHGGGEFRQDAGVLVARWRSRRASPAGELGLGTGSPIAR
ncbi:PP2C family protein-serine/threonine phosphatase [Amycolatopsis sp. DG1A-15b]|uniref:PP2C family protein-serine/threonine phosphatase n=1 Tax=Amycolatopsis sp. DG1A-15b TaxID=3052846 RepID=UPI00255BFD9B|nr:PP2C family protein-serine/threonine phosphatase [Amycolatopsis sp. DG1A-15b]WIX90779.1 PP2C family protein-serine/threonine phosphatase [Amycolatopsis sp. DG1A-15b]